MYLNDIYTIGANLAGLPAISVPIAKSGHLSVSLQLIADHFQEPTLFQGAYLVEQLASLRSER
jgi:aspartyl-tRNA(Asn)/glutamyl-tRNA(Gln) amidotransferase subunit A